MKIMAFIYFVTGSIFSPLAHRLKIAFIRYQIDRVSRLLADEESSTTYFSVVEPLETEIRSLRQAALIDECDKYLIRVPAYSREEVGKWEVVNSKVFLKDEIIDDLFERLINRKKIVNENYVVSLSILTGFIGALASLVAIILR